MHAHAALLNKSEPCSCLAQIVAAHRRWKAEAVVQTKTSVNEGEGQAMTLVRDWHLVHHLHAHHDEENIGQNQNRFQYTDLYAKI